MVDRGQQAPRFNLPDSQFRPFPLEAYLGRPVVLVFFPAVFSPVCTRELAELQTRLPALASRGVQVAGISVDGPYALRAFAQQHGISFPLLSDFHRETIRAYEIEDPNFLGLQGAARRAIFLVDADGVIRYKWVADRPRTEPDYEELQEAVRSLPDSQPTPQ